MAFLNQFGVEPFSAMVLIINLGIAFLILSSLRFVLGFVAGVDSKDELAEKDNPAFGITLAGVIMGVTIMLTGVVYGDASDNIKTELVSVLGYGILGIFLMSVTKTIFYKVTMPLLDVNKEIDKQNIAIAILDAGNVIASAVMVRAVLVWTESVTFKGALMVLLGYLLSQLLLTLASRVQRYKYRSYHGRSLQDALKLSNVATAWHVIGYRIGVALAITAATSYIPYSESDIAYTIFSWVALSLVLMLSVAVLTWIAERMIFTGICIRDEIDVQQNLGLSVAHALLTVSVGLLLASLLA